MITTAMIIFREIFEICIILGIISVATNTVSNRKKFIIWGVISGIVGSIILAFIFKKVTALFEGFGQEILNISILSVAVILIAYTVIWMNSNAKLFSTNLNKTSQEIKVGLKPLYAISIIIATTILREGAEIFLFLSGVHAAGATTSEMIKGFFLGLTLGSLSGFLTYKGLLKFSYKYIFTITSWLLIFLAAAMTSKIAIFLAAADIVTIFSEPLWDSSWMIAETSSVGKILNALIGYDANPSGMQIIFYSLTIFIISLNIILPKKRHKSS